MEPLVVTLALDPAAQERFDRERAALFPPGRTAVGAHLTLFHAVPGARADAAVEDVAAACDRPPFRLRVDRVLRLGRGVAYGVTAPELVALHRGLQHRWWDDLTPQDRQGLRAHVTVQNKVDPATARATAERLEATFAPFEVGATGVAVWRYVGGPWVPVTTVPFRGPGPAS